MKILHYSDKADKQYLKLYEQADLMIATGDLTFFDFLGLRELEARKPEFGVYGNHDSGLYLEELGIINLHQKIYELNGLTWGGFQGCLQYKPKGIQYTEQEAEEFAYNFPQVDVLLLHAGARDMLDDPSDSVHIGSRAIAHYIRQKKPQFVFCGHQYSNAELILEDTKIFRTYGSRIIEI